MGEAQAIHPVAIVGGHPDERVAGSVRPRIEDAYWAETFASRPYVKPGEPYARYRPAYRHGWESRARYGEFAWDDVAADIERDWETRRDPSDLAWTEACNAVRDAWERLQGDENASAP